jgi:hypothetical protein
MINEFLPDMDWISDFSITTKPSGLDKPESLTLSSIEN